MVNVSKHQIIENIVAHPKNGELDLDLDSDVDGGYDYLDSCYNEDDLKEMLDMLNS